MKEYGVTADTCQSTMTVYYKDANGKEQKHVLRIGFSTFTASPTYYVALEGRNSVYRFSGAVEGAVLYSICDYIQPVVYVGYQSSSEAMIDITSFSITKGYLNDSSSLKPIIFLTGKPSVSAVDGTESTEYTAHVMDGNGNIIKSTAADADYVVILDSGKIAAEGTPLQLKNKYTGDYLTMYNAKEEEVASLGVPFEKTPQGIRICVENTAKATELIVQNPHLFTDYELTKGKMDDVFLAVTGKTLVGGGV
jgi:hypothetical protein